MVVVAKLATLVQGSVSTGSTSLRNIVWSIKSREIEARSADIPGEIYPDGPS